MRQYLCWPLMHLSRGIHKLITLTTMVTVCMGNDANRKKSTKNVKLTSLLACPFFISFCDVMVSQREQFSSLWVSTSASHPKIRGSISCQGIFSIHILKKGQFSTPCQAFQLRDVKMGLYESKFKGWSHFNCKVWLCIPLNSSWKIYYLLSRYVLFINVIFFILGKKIDYLYFYRDSQLMKKWFTSRPGK